MNSIPWYGWLGIGFAVASLLWMVVVHLVLDQRDHARWETDHRACPRRTKAQHDGETGCQKGERA